MKPSPDVAVVGGGVVGLTVALTLARAGARVALVDAGRPSNASSVAAGMLAPASETVLEGGDRAMLARLLAARDLWPALEASTPGLTIDRSGAVLIPPPGERREVLLSRLESAGVACRLQPPFPGVLLPDDWSVDPPGALAALRAAAVAAGVTLRTGVVAAEACGLLLGGEPLQAASVVIAAGYGARGLCAAAPELEHLAPVKGQIAVFGGPPALGPVLRGAEVYLAPQPSGARAGATMEFGRDDEAVDAATVSALAGKAAALQPRLATAAYTGAAGVRAATPDGWPLVGPSATSGVWLAVGARRNGWLLAPMMAGLIADHLAGRAAGPLAQAFHPGRFTR